MTEKPKNIWVENRKEMLNFLKSMKVTKKTDRLEILRNWIATHNILNESIMGWAQWLNSIGLMEKISKEGLSELFKSYRKFTEAFLEFDIDATEALTELQEEIKSQEEKPKELPFYAR